MTAGSPTARPPSLSGLNEDEARGFHKLFMTSFMMFTIIAIVAHILVWQWRPWIPGVAGYEVPAASTTP
jgi:light-harvesting complex 1 beta chain